MWSTSLCACEARFNSCIEVSCILSHSPHLVFYTCIRSIDYLQSKFLFTSVKRIAGVAVQISPCDYCISRICSSVSRICFESISYNTCSCVPLQKKKPVTSHEDPLPSKEI